jgi:hypothetical protein
MALWSEQTRIDNMDSATVCDMVTEFRLFSPICKASTPIRPRGMIRGLRGMISGRDRGVN